MDDPHFQASGTFEYVYTDAETSVLRIFSTKTMRSDFFTAQETVDLLHFLQSHHAEIERKAQQQAQAAQQPKPQKTIDQRIDDLFH